MINLELFRVFYTVAKCGSLTKAADELFISQPAVSQAIKQLEQQLGGKLFNRVSRGMELTDMELAITGRTCTIMGKGVKMDGTARYPVVITMAVTGIDETTITLPTDITDN